MVTIDNRQNRIPVPEDLLARVAEVIGRTVALEGREGEVSLSLVDDEEIRVLNQRWRQIDRPTDVLSFPMEDDDLLGDVVISLPRAAEQARDYGHSLQREVCFLAVHGTLHLMGYDHAAPEEEARMMERAEAVLQAAGLSR